jgi:hypothetical protein
MLSKTSLLTAFSNMGERGYFPFLKNLKKRSCLDLANAPPPPPAPLSCHAVCLCTLPGTYLLQIFLMCIHGTRD